MLVRVCVSGMCAQWGRGGPGRGKCTGKDSLRGSVAAEVPSVFLCVLEDGFMEHVTLLSLFVYRPSPLLLEFNWVLIEVIAIHLSPEIEMILTLSECFSSSECIPSYIYLYKRLHAFFMPCLYLVLNNLIYVYHLFFSAFTELVLLFFFFF